MIYGIYKQNKLEAAPNLQANCPCCGAELTPKCGEFNVWHWAHKSKKNCDSWHGNETQWHKDWKNKFPLSRQEVVMRDNITNEKHIADVKLNNGLVIEFQNSSITAEEIRQREKFYGKMIWVVNADKFKDNIFDFDTDKRWAFFRWERFRKCWGFAKMPVFLDFPNGGPTDECRYLDGKKTNIISADYSDTLIWFKEHLGYACYSGCCKHSKSKSSCSYCGSLFFNCRGRKVSKKAFLLKYTS
tara:strand:+ start:64 stop:792 length:729 start_codon:yes stop_codon:yes gene_type:complete